MITPLTEYSVFTELEQIQFLDHSVVVVCFWYTDQALYGQRRYIHQCY